MPRSQLSLVPRFDHAPISLEIALQYPNLDQPHQRLNESLIQDPEIKADSLWELDLFFESNKGSVPNPLSIWSAHKCYIRGVFIKHGHRLKVARAKTLSLSKLHDCIRRHKTQPDKILEAEVTSLLEQIREHSLFQAKNKLLKPYMNMETNAADH